MDQEIRALYTLQDDGRSLVPRGHLPTSRRAGAPAEEHKARQRMHRLLNPNYAASAAEVQVLSDNGIALKERVPGRPDKGYHIDPNVPRQSEEDSASARAGGAFEMAKLYTLQDDGRPPVPYGHLPTSERAGAPAEEHKARQRMHRLLNPNYAASAAEVQVLSDNGIALKERVPGRPDKGYHIDPNVPRHSEETSASAKADGAFEMAKLYTLQDDGQPPVPYGHLPASRRDGAPAEENKARQRMHTLLKPKLRASAAEVQVLSDNGIALKERVPGRPDKGYHIDPNVPRHSEKTSASTKADGAFEMAKLYTLQDNGQPPVPYGHLPTSRRDGAPAEEHKARQRMHTLLNPNYAASAAEVQVLSDNGIALKERVPGRPDKGYHIDPNVPRHSEETFASAKADGAFEMAKLYTLQDNGQPPVPYGHLPTNERAGAPAEEHKARQRMHKLLNPNYVASAAEVQVLSDNGIALKERVPGRPDKGYHIDPNVPRQSEETFASAKADGAFEMAKLYTLQDNGQPPVPYGHLPASRRDGAPAEENKARLRMYKLLNPNYVASAAEVQVLSDNGIALKERVPGRPDKGYHIDPNVPRQSQNPVGYYSSRVPEGYPSQESGNHSAAFPPWTEGMSDAASAVPSSYSAGSSAWDAAAMRESAPQVSGHYGGDGYPVNTTQPGLYLPSSYGYRYAESSFEAGPASDTGPSAHGDQPSKRGRRR
ncbi:hypothetical protein ABTZ59_12555 [Streptomyces sp. NPDC094034]|uniref:hypothetical protein n=1 Tax=Streptomyces sp. NPDC094034 TaxID=3155309 RepID=UPI0033248A20